jgi:CheY-like chemotaxis protein
VGQPRTFDLARTVASIVSMLKYKKPGVTVALESAPTSALLTGDEDEMNQALLNVGTNAVEAMSTGSLIVSFRVLEPRTLGGARIARVTFRDEGVGMTEEQCARIFEPLYTTKASSGGSGLGLTLVHKTVTAHRGTIDVESRPGEGTRVILELPLVGESSAATRLPSNASDKLNGTFLLVDDDDRVRSATQRQLVSAGAEVHAFPDGLAAFAAVDAGLDFTAAVVDVNMPGWSGPELVDRLVSRLGRPLPVVLVTGASGELVPGRLLESGHVALVRKPWTRKELTESLRDVIAAVTRSEATTS